MSHCHIYKLGDSFDKNGLKTVINNLDLTYKVSTEREITTVQWKRMKGIISAYGTIILWNFDEEHEENLILKLSSAVIGKYEEIQKDIFDVSRSSNFSVRNDCIYLNDYSIEILTAISYALSQSIELNRIEDVIQETIKPIVKITSDLANKGQINISSREIKKYIGRILLKKNDINIKLNLIDTPEFFWDNPEIEKYYLKTRAYVEIDERVDVLNEKLSLLQDSLDILRDEKNAHHSSRLEIIIIILIVFEVIMGILSF